MAETWGVDEIRIDANTAAAVIIRASLFMLLTGSGFCLGIAGFFYGNRRNPCDFDPSTASNFGLSHRAQSAVFVSRC